MSELVRSHHFAGFHAEGTITQKSISRILTGRPEEDALPHSLGIIKVAIEHSRFNNGDAWFYSKSNETGLFVIHGIKRAQESVITPAEKHPTITFTNKVEAYGKFLHVNPSAYTADDLAHGLSFNEDEDAVEFGSAKLVVPKYSHEERILPVTIGIRGSIPHAD